ncbi:MAG: hypothetical protein WBZ29_01090 [Methanocella sp.]
MEKGHESGGQVKKISISLSDDVLDWVYENKEDLKVSTFINRVLREHMRSGDTCNVCEELTRVERRLGSLEKAMVEYRSPGTKSAGSIGTVAPATTRPAEVFGELVHIRNVSAENARAVIGELVPFMRMKKVIYRDLVLQELFPHTRSTITNEINYWYNACKGVLDTLIERGYVEKIEKGKYRWVGGKRQPVI